MNKLKLNKDDTRSPNEGKLKQNKQINLLPYVYLSKTSIRFLKDFGPQCMTGKYV